MDKEHYHPSQGQAGEKHPSSGYIYLVKNPATNETSVCAWDSVLYPGVNVIMPTRYGLDLGVVVGDASELGKPYVPGSTECHGVCSRCENAYADPQPLAAAGEPDSQVDEILWDEEPDVHPCDECGLCSSAKDPRMVDIKGGMLWLARLATPSDMSRYHELSSREDEAMRVCRERIAAHHLDMRLICAHFMLGEQKILFFFTSETRVDFRDLVKDLVSLFRIRIELRQIGVRDESRLLGGLAVCGRDFCCHALGGKLSPVSIKMAKEQNLSLNSMKISGPCGRLLCCLAYENDFYVESAGKFPHEGSKIKLDGELMTVTSVNIFSKKITLSGVEHGSQTIPSDACFYNSDEHHWELTKEYLDSREETEE